MKYLAEKDLKRIKEEEEDEERASAEEKAKEAQEKECEQGPTPPPYPPTERHTTSEVKMGQLKSSPDDELNEDVQWAMGCTLESFKASCRATPKR